MAKKRGFTLIELLVVIAIIALLLSILMPSLRKVKQQAKAVVCSSNLKQWATIWSLYLENNSNRFPTGVPYVWVEPLRGYYKGGGEEMRVCPTATKSEDEGGSGWFIAWDHPGSAIPPEEYRGSYGINNWLYDCPDPLWWGQDTSFNWRRGDVSGANRIPVFMDCWRWGGTPYSTDAPYDTPPQKFADYLDAEALGGINRFCLNRHNGNINILFLDMAVSKVGLKQLWKLKWSKNFDPSGYKETWPDWMNPFSE